jgi:putative endonuclease
VTVARQTLGRRAERIAAERLGAAGWRILDRNLRLAEGELDLVALDGRTVVFVEVKAGRLGARRGPERPALAVGPRKQLRLRRLARAWIGAGLTPPGTGGYRFDVIGISFGADGAVAAYEHIRAAF